MNKLIIYAYYKELSNYLKISTKIPFTNFYSRSIIIKNELSSLERERN